MYQYFLESRLYLSDILWFPNRNFCIGLLQKYVFINVIFLFLVDLWHGCRLLGVVWYGKEKPRQSD